MLDTYKDQIKWVHQKFPDVEEEGEQWLANVQLLREQQDMALVLAQTEYIWLSWSRMDQ